MSTLAPTDTGKPRSPYSIEVLHKAFDIIDVFGHEHPSLTLKQIVALTDLPKTTVFRILSTLVERNGLPTRSSNADALILLLRTKLV